MAAFLLNRAGMKTTQVSPFHAAVERFMTPEPHCIGRDQPLSVAHECMRSLNVRHLPVLDGGKLVGILSQRDVFFVETSREGQASTKVEDAMSPEVYTVSPDKVIGEVAARMVERKYGCAVVTRGERVVGIFTTTDALRVLVGIVDAWR